MKIHGISLVKNEADVFEETLRSALDWCDHIYVFDNGSDDGTWELVNRLADRHPQITPYKQDDVPYTNGLRADVFNAYREHADPGDWWCGLDADEIYIDDPRIFLKKIPDKFQTVWSASFNYYFTEKDALLYQQDPVAFVRTPVQQRFHYYLNNWGELRFFRHRQDIDWNRNQGGFPPATITAPAYPVRIWLKHYQYRSPEQIERRLATRRPAMQARAGFLHEVTPNWRTSIAAKRDAPLDFAGAGPEFAGARWHERVVPAASLDHDAFDCRYVVNESLMPEFPPRPRRALVRGAIPEPIRAVLGRMERRMAFFLGRTEQAQ